LNKVYKEESSIASLSVSEDKRERLKESNSVFIVSHSMIKFPLTFPGENMKGVFSIKNAFKENINIDLQFVLKEKNLIKHQLDGQFSQYKDIIEGLENSQSKYNCFEISATQVSLSSFAEMNFEIELNAPKIKNKEDLFAVLQITCNLGNKTSYFFLPIFAYVEIPKLLCLKELYVEKCNFPLIAILLNTSSKGQKVKIPFRNFSLKDFDIEFYFERNTALQNKILINNQMFEAQFLCFPSVLVMPSHSTTFLELVVKVIKVRQDENSHLIKNKNMIRKVLIAKVKNANAYYTFFLEASFN